MKYLVLASAVLSLVACTDDRPKPAAGPVLSEVSAPVAPVVSNEIKITKWGPQGTPAGKGFSVQSTGNSALWFEFTGQGNAANIEVWFADKKLEAAIVPNTGGSAEVPPDLIAAPGSYPVYLMNTATGKRIDVGNFVVSPAS